MEHMQELDEVTVTARRPFWMRHPVLTAVFLASAALLIARSR